MKRQIIAEVIKYTHYQGNEKDKFNRYRQLLLLYNKHHALMTDIITNLHKYASFKSYLYILSLNKDDKLENLIFNVLINTLKDDIQKLNYEKEPSKLARWLPREGSHFDLTLNFVNRFVLRLYPELFLDENNLKKNLQWAKCQYRKTISTLNRALETLEVLMLENKEINYEKLTRTQINKYFYKFLKEDGEKFTMFLEKKYMERGIQIIDDIFTPSNIKHDVEKQICCNIWQENKCTFYEELSTTFNEDSDLLVDITQMMFYEKIVPRVIVLVLMFLEHKRDVYINNNKLQINGEFDIFDKVNYIKQCIRPSTSIIVPKNSTKKNLYVVTTKEIENLDLENYSQVIMYTASCIHQNIFKKEKVFIQSNLLMKCQELLFNYFI
jgi:hypothetical protein